MGIPPAFASIEKRLPTASFRKIFPGIKANYLSPESPGMTSLVSSVLGIPPAFASIEKRLPTASSRKIFPGIKPFRYGRSNRKTLILREKKKTRKN